VRTDGLADPARGALADAICRAATAHSLGWGILRVAACIADRFVTTPRGEAYLAAAAQAQVDLLAHVAVSLAAKVDGCDALGELAHGHRSVERQVLRAIDFQLPAPRHGGMPASVASAASAASTASARAPL